jgi:hypothetical protein
VTGTSNLEPATNINALTADLFDYLLEIVDDVMENGSITDKLALIQKLAPYTLKDDEARDREADIARANLRDMIGRMWQEPPPPRACPGCGTEL